MVRYIVRIVITSNATILERPERYTERADAESAARELSRDYHTLGFVLSELGDATSVVLSTYDTGKARGPLFAG